MTEAYQRPRWDEYFLSIAQAVATRGDCRRQRVGAVVVDIAHRIVSTGYNGHEPGGRSCLRGECPRGLMDHDTVRGAQDWSDCEAIHAEHNAILYGDRERMKGATIYLTHQPCFMCKRVIRAAGIYRVVWNDGSWSTFRR